MQPLRLVALLAVAGAICGQNQKTAGVSGHVTSMSTGAPVAGAMVVLFPLAIPEPGEPGAQEAGRRATSTALSGADGRYQVEGLRPGEYIALAVRGGFAQTNYGAPAVNGAGTAFTLTAGNTKSQVDFQLSSAGSISGLVLDAANEPLPGIAVLALQRRNINGIGQYVEQARGVSNAKGQYRIEGLEEGSWFVSTGFNAEGAMSVTASAPGGRVPERKEKYVPTYFPNGTRLTSAAPIEIRGGPSADVQGINLRPAKAKLATVRGKVADQTGTGSPIILVLLPRAATTAGVRRQVNIFSASEEFVFPDVPPGDYLLTAEIHVTDQRVTQGRFGYEGRQLISVGEEPVDNLLITVNRGLDLPGQLRVEDGKIPDLKSLEVRLPVADLEGRTIGFPAKGPVAEDGRFVVRAASLDRHVANVVGLPKGFYIKSFTSGGGLDLIRNELDLTPGIAGPLEIVISGKAPAISGMVTDRDGKPVPRATVAMVPEAIPFRNHTRFFTNTTTSADGRFSIGSLTPGDYRVYAFEKVEDGAWMNAEFIAPFSGEKVLLREGATETLNLKLIPAPR